MCEKTGKSEVDEKCKECVRYRSHRHSPRSWILPALLLLMIPAAATSAYVQLRNVESTANILQAVAFGTGLFSTAIFVGLFTIHLPMWLFGGRVYAWTDQLGRLHFHTHDWWRTLANDNTEAHNQAPKGSILSLWLGPWPFRSSFIGEAKGWWDVTVRGEWTIFPNAYRTVQLTDKAGNSVQIPLIIRGGSSPAWNGDLLRRLLTVIDQEKGISPLVDKVLRDAVQEPIAGQISAS